MARRDRKPKPGTAEGFYTALRKIGCERCQFCGDYTYPEHWVTCPKWDEEVGDETG